jgi:F0F1-type ATP synthase membrane subunit b/b'
MPTTPHRDKLTGLLTDQAEAQPPPPTWETHIVIPLVQNLAGGFAVYTLCWTVTVGLGRYLLWDVILRELNFWSFVIGGSVTAIMTIIRFFGDEIGLLAAAYRMGKRSADSRISALIAENEQLQATVRELRGSATTHRAQELAGRVQRAQEDAEHLLALAYGGQSIAREKVKDYIPQRNWERAIQLLRAAGCLTESNELAAENLGLALHQLRSYTQSAQDPGATWRPAWYIRAKTNSRPQSTTRGTP